MPKGLDHYIDLAQQSIEVARGALAGGTRTMRELAQSKGRSVTEIAEALLADIESEVAEAKKMKTVGGEKFPASDFLVVEDPASPSTWHLQVKKNGSPDHALMGAAKAALTSPSGHRGNRYEGPDADKATKALKALYKSEDMPWSDAEKKTKESAADIGEEIAEVAGDLHDKANQVESAFDIAFAPETRWREGYTPRYSTRSVFEADPVVGDSIIVIDQEEAKTYAVGYTRESDGIKFSPRVEWREVVLAYQLVSTESEQPEQTTEPEPHPPQTQELHEIDFNEWQDPGEDYKSLDVNGHVLSISETGDVATGGTKPLVMEVVPVAPGWGNTRDNNYYSKEALKNDGPSVFQKVKMHETNHKDDETNDRNWVSTIIEVERFTENGEPIARVGVHNPLFAQKVLNLNELGLLDMLECSIRGNGRARKEPFEENGRKGRYIESLTEIKTVDWVSRAGAGGRALNLTENAAGGGDMPGDENTNVSEGEQIETEEVNIGEGNVAQPVPLTETQVDEALSSVALPDRVKTLVKAGVYESDDKLKETVAGLIEDFKTATKSGRPVATRSQNTTQVPQRPNEVKISEAITRVNDRYFGNRRRPVREAQQNN